MKSIFYTFTCAIFLLTSCHSHEEEHEHKHGHHHHANDHMNKTSFEDLVKRFESEERNTYQKPDSVLAFLGDITGQTIMDIGAGTGYFSFRLAEAGAKVIAADVDDRFQQYIADKKAELGVTDEQVELRKIPYDVPSLAEEEADMVLIVNTYHHIEDRSSYFKKVKAGLKPDGRLVVIDFFKKDAGVGPPVEMKMSAEKVTEELKAAGFTSFENNDTLLEHQYILIAQ